MAGERGGVYFCTPQPTPTAHLHATSLRRALGDNAGENGRPGRVQHAPTEPLASEASCLETSLSGVAGSSRPSRDGTHVLETRLSEVCRCARMRLVTCGERSNQPHTVCLLTCKR